MKAPVAWASRAFNRQCGVRVAAHVALNGDLADVPLFAIFAALGVRPVDCRKIREMGTEWRRLRTAVAGAPRLPHWVALARLLAGVALHVALIWLHPFVFRVSPLT